MSFNPEQQPTYSKRDILGLNYLSNRDLVVVHNNQIVIPNRPPEYVGFPGIEKIEILAAIASGLTTEALRTILITRRHGFKVGAAVAGATVVGFPKITRANSAGVIIEAQYEPAKGNQGLPWGSAAEIVDGVWDGAFDKYDGVDQAWNGSKARSVYWKSTKVWMKEVCRGALRTGSPGWTGFCEDAAVSSWFTPVIGGPITVSGITFSEPERQKIGTFYFAGLRRNPEFSSVTGNVAEIVSYQRRGDCISVNRTPVSGEDWFGVITGIQPNGDFDISRPTGAGERGAQLETRVPSTLKEARVFTDVNTPQPGREGNFSIIDRDMGGLIIGTRWVA